MNKRTKVLAIAGGAGAAVWLIAGTLLKDVASPADCLFLAAILPLLVLPFAFDTLLTHRLSTVAVGVWSFAVVAALPLAFARAIGVVGKCTSLILGCAVAAGVLFAFLGWVKRVCPRVGVRHALSQYH
ncbi:MAG: hypothetical protein ACE5HE_05935 [Phycisphaerae bacterium]